MASTAERYGRRRRHWCLQRPKTGVLDDAVGGNLAEKDDWERTAAERSKAVETGRDVGGSVWT